MAEKSIEQRQIWKALSHHLWPADNKGFRIRVVVALCSLLLAKVTAVFIPAFYEKIIDGLEQGSAYLPLWILLAYGFGRLLQQLFSELRDILFAKVSQRAQRSAALDVFRHLHSLSLQFHLNRQTGGLSQKLSRGLRAMQFSLGFLLFNIVPSIFELLMVAGVLLYRFDPVYAIIVVSSVVLYVVFTLAITEWRLHYRKQMNQAENKSSSFSVDSLLNYETVKYFRRERSEANRYDQLLASYEKSALASQSSLSVLNLGQSAIIATGLVIITFLAVDDVEQGNLTIGSFVLINSYLIQLYLPLNFLGFVYRELKQSFLDMENMFQLKTEVNEVQEPDNPKELSGSIDSIDFKNVDFSYGDERKILKNLSFSVKSGQSLGVVGPTGSGKSTIGRLLFRFYDVNSGSIELNKVNIKEIEQEKLRAKIAMVPQDTIMFNNTLRYNISYGLEDASDEEIRHALKISCLDEFISQLPDGLDTLVGERGLKLSGGERQRVALARVCLLKPDIIVFDEATSALDSETESIVQNYIMEYFSHSAKIIIAHRLSTIVAADNILVLNNGQQEETGTHEELLNKGGIYASLWFQQSKDRLS